MGMYTELVMATRLKDETPSEVTAELAGMLNSYAVEERTDLPMRWPFMLRSDSYYFDGDTHSTFRYDDIAKTHFLTVRTNLKNYEGEIERFLEWIAPYADNTAGAPDSGFVGYMRYEEEEEPTLIYLRDGLVSYHRVDRSTDTLPTP